MLLKDILCAGAFCHAYLADLLLSLLSGNVCLTDNALWAASILTKPSGLSSSTELSLLICLFLAFLANLLVILSFTSTKGFNLGSLAMGWYF